MIQEGGAQEPYTPARDKQLRGLVEKARQLPGVQAVEKALAEQAKANKAAIKIVRAKLFEKEANQFYNHLITHKEIPAFLKVHEEFFKSLEGKPVLAFNAIKKHWKTFRVKAKREVEKAKAWKAKKANARESRKKDLPPPVKGETKYYSPESYLYDNPKVALPLSQYIAAMVDDVKKLTSFKTDARARSRLAIILNDVYEGKVPRKVPYSMGPSESSVSTREIFDSEGKLKVDLKNRHVLSTIIYYLYGVIFPYNLQFLEGRRMPEGWALDDDKDRKKITQQLKAV